MIQDTAWIQEGEWGDENTPEVQETLELDGHTLLIDYRDGLYNGRRTV